MYNYLCKPTKKKPLCELEPEPYVSPLHPHGDEMRELLAHTEKDASPISATAPRAPGPGTDHDYQSDTFTSLFDQHRGLSRAK